MNILNDYKLSILFILSIFLYSIYVKFFTKAVQTERILGLESHKSKTGSLTCGGILFLTLPLLFIEYNEKIIMIVLGTTLFGLLGLIDDIFIIIFKNNKGILPGIKLLLQIIIGGIIWYIYLYFNNPTSISLFGLVINLKWVYGLLMVWVLISSTNAWNLLDGIDGLCGGCSLIFGIGLGIISYQMKEYEILKLLIIYHIPLFVFWCFNLPKAFLFMGNVGSLGLGALYCCVSFYLNTLTSFVVMAGLFIFETISVIVQVWYYKKTNGKRIFKMAPFHHHLEMSGFKEIQVDILFYIIQLILTIFVIIFMS